TGVDEANGRDRTRIRQRGEEHPGGQFLGGSGREVPIEAQCLAGLGQGVNYGSREHYPGGMEAELERGDDPEVAAAPAQTPEQVRVLFLAGSQELAVGGDDVGGKQVVAGQAVLTQEP